METYGKLHALGLVLHEAKIIQDDNLLQLLNRDDTKTYVPSMIEKVYEGMEAFIK